MNTRKSIKYFGITITQIILIIFMITQLFPIIWLAYSSIKPADEIRANMLALPKSVDFSNYDIQYWYELNVRLPIFFRNSLIVSALSLILIISFSLLAAYAIAKIRFPGKNIILVLLIILMGIPAQAILIPVYYLIGDLGLLNNFLGLILVYTAMFSPFSVLLLQAYFRDFPDEIIEAAEIDGSTRIRTFIAIVIPNNIGGIISVLIVNFLFIWNEYVFSLIILKNESVKTLPVGISGFRGAWVSEWGPMFAGLFLALIPSIAFYAIFHKNIMRGMMGGSLKE